MDDVMNTPFGDINAADAEAAMNAAAKADGRRNIEEITIKFAKGLCSEPFTSKDGTELVRIQIPNADPEDHSPWQEFVLGAKYVHENQYGKGLWVKIPADGHTTVSRPFLAGQDENGKNRWDSERRSVPNRELKEMVEFYKTHGRDERTPASSDREPQEKTAGNRSGGPEPDGPGDKESPEEAQEKPSVKDQLAAGKKEAAKTKSPKAKTDRKQNKESER